MADEKSEVQPYSEFAQLPLESIIAAPLVAAIRAQTVAAQAFRDYLEVLVPNGRTVDAEFSSSQTNGAAATSTKIRAPLIALVPAPHLRIDSLSIQFRYEIKQTSKQSKSTDASGSASAKSGALISPWVQVELSGSISSRSGSESETNRSGTLEINVQASEAPMPEGLSKVLSALTSTIRTEPATTVGAGASPQT